MFRLETNLTKLSNTQLKTIVENCIDRGIDFDRYLRLFDCFSELRSRVQVRAAASAIDALEKKLTITTRSAPSEESMAWSNLEGGHTFHKKPDLKIAELLK